MQYCFGTANRYWVLQLISTLTYCVVPVHADPFSPYICCQSHGMAQTGMLLHERSATTILGQLMYLSFCEVSAWSSAACPSKASGMLRKG